MGNVYRAQQVIAGAPGRDQASAQQPFAFTYPVATIQTGIHAAAQLRHGNIVPVFAVGQEKNVHYIAMQLIAGCSLEKVDYRTWATDGCRPLITTAIELADGLAHAHECGIIHRDIKPSNLILDQQSKVWITDFGWPCAKAIRVLTMSGDLIGTMNYMSPRTIARRTSR